MISKPIVAKPIQIIDGVQRSTITIPTPTPKSQEASQ